YHKTLVVPVVSDTHDGWNSAQNVLDLPSQTAQGADIILLTEVKISPSKQTHLQRRFDRVRLELAHVQARPWLLFGERVLPELHEDRCVLLVKHFHNELRVVELLLLGRHRRPEPRPTAPHKRGEGFEDRPRLPLPIRMGTAIVRRDGADDLL